MTNDESDIHEFNKINNMIEITRKCVICLKNEITLQVPMTTENFTSWDYLLCDDCNKEIER